MVLFVVAVLGHFIAVALVAGVETAGTEVRVGTIVAIVVLVADVIARSEFDAVRVRLRGLDGFVSGPRMTAVYEMRSDSEPVEEAGGLFQVEAAGEDGFVDAGNGELNGGGIIGWGQQKRSKLHVDADGVNLEW